ncbi:MAG: NUDIX domain-containing protein [Chitinophagaceae bacterium]|nr:NUDIX domain-containing protein [Chitinophagaceae bacterium]
MYIKIYFDDKPLFLCDTVDEDLQPYIHHDDAIFIDELDSHTVKSMIHEMQLAKIHAGVFYHSNLEELRKAFYKKFTIIQAAGGLVLNEKKEILMIFRRGKWDLPKGKLDKGEKLEDCAVREVEEETGLQKIKLLSPLTITFHTYHEGTKYVLKESHWYNMKVSGDQKLVPQTEEDIHAIKWVTTKEAEKLFPDCFPSVIDVIKEFMK